MVLTVEPGLYIPPDDKTAQNIACGVRIEDDVLSKKDGNRKSDLESSKGPGRDRSHNAEGPQVDGLNHLRKRVG
jgi:Xaa-Pro aminopeptidase